MSTKTLAMAPFPPSQGKERYNGIRAIVLGAVSAPATAAPSSSSAPRSNRPTAIAVDLLLSLQLRADDCREELDLDGDSQRLQPPDPWPDLDLDLDLDLDPPWQDSAIGALSDGLNLFRTLADEIKETLEGSAVAVDPDTAPTDFIVTGSWGDKDFKEAAKYSKPNLLWSGKPTNYTAIPSFDEIQQTPDASFLHICANETIHGVEFKNYPPPILNRIPLLPPNQPRMAAAATPNSLLLKKHTNLLHENPCLKNFAPITKPKIPSLSISCTATQSPAAASATSTASYQRPVFKFAAGPATLPESVLLRAQAELFDFRSSGMSIMEMSHRGKEFDSVIKKAESDLRRLLSIPDDYSVLFLHGGATAQFAALPLNLCSSSTAASDASTKLAIISIGATKEIPNPSFWNGKEGSAFNHFSFQGQSSWIKIMRPQFCLPTAQE